jgi:hypothetical protein
MATQLDEVEERLKLIEDLVRGRGTGKGKGNNGPFRGKVCVCRWMMSLAPCLIVPLTTRTMARSFQFETKTPLESQRGLPKGCTFPLWNKPHRDTKPRYSTATLCIASRTSVAHLKAQMIKPVPSMDAALCLQHLVLVA